MTTVVQQCAVLMALLPASLPQGWPHQPLSQLNKRVKGYLLCHACLASRIPAAVYCLPKSVLFVCTESVPWIALSQRFPNAFTKSRCLTQVGCRLLPDAQQLIAS